MTNLVVASAMGVVEGLTEFLPVSSTGHLILAGHAMGFTGELANTFEIFIQLGAILAVVMVYWRTFFGLLRPARGPGFDGWPGVGLLLVTTLPGLVAGKLLHGVIKTHLFSPMTVAAGLAVGAVWILVAERRKGGASGPGLEGLTWRLALGIGLIQCLALWPGMSRSTCTILGALALGLNRRAATEYSFFAAVPLLAAACLYDLYENAHLLQGGMAGLFATGFLISFLSAWAAIRLFIKLVSRYTLAAFGWYRLALAAVVVLLMR